MQSNEMLKGKRTFDEKGDFCKNTHSIGGVFTE